MVCLFKNVALGFSVFYFLRESYEGWLDSWYGIGCLVVMWTGRRQQVAAVVVVVLFLQSVVVGV